MHVAHRSTAPVLMIGHPSSGTSILSRLVREYLGVAFGTESQFIAYYYKRLGRYGDLGVDANVSRLIGDLLHERWFERSGKFNNFETSLEAVFGDVGERSYRGVLEAVFGQLQQHLGMSRWGDKLSVYPHDLHILGELFPDARYIHMMRDGRDVALSVMGRYFGAKNVYTAAREWVDTVEMCDAFVATLPARQVLEVRYEDLLTDPVHTFSRLIGFLEIDDSDGQIAARIERDVPGRLDRGNFDKWRHRWSESRRLAFERVGCRALQRHGYETLINVPGAEPGLVARLYWYCDHKVRIWTYPEYWWNNLYRLKVRTRDVWRALRSMVY